MCLFCFLCLHLSKYNSSIVGYVEDTAIAPQLSSYWQVLFQDPAHLCTKSHAQVKRSPPLLPTNYSQHLVFSCNDRIPKFSISNVLSFGPENVITVNRAPGNCLFQMARASTGVGLDLKL